MTGIPFPDITTRLAMLDEALTCIRSLWSKERTTFAGRFYHFQDAILFPKPKHAMPIILGGSGKGLLRVAAKHADVINIISDVGKAGRIEIENIQKLTDESFRSKIRFVREEAKRCGRDPGKIRVSNVVFTLLLAETRKQAEEAGAGMAAVFGSPEAVRRSPMTLVGTPQECIAELKRRAREWEVSQVIFSGGAEQNLSRLWNEVLRHV